MTNNIKNFKTNATSLQEKTLEALRKTASFNAYNKNMFEDKFAFNVLKGSLILLYFFLYLYFN